MNRTDTMQTFGVKCLLGRVKVVFPISSQFGVLVKQLMLKLPIVAEKGKSASQSS